MCSAAPADDDPIVYHHNGEKERKEGRKCGLMAIDILTTILLKNIDDCFVNILQAWYLTWFGFKKATR